jgi:Tail fiber protein gp32
MSLTAANAIITLSQTTLFSSPFQLSQFAADDVTGMAEVTILEDQMGVDGVLSFGFVWVPREQEITLKADSPSIAFFDQISTQQEAVQDVYPLNGTILLPAIGKLFNLINGGLRRYKPMPDVKKVLQPQRFGIIWNRVVPVNTR